MHGWVDVALAIGSIAAVLVGSFGSYLLAKRDNRNHELEQRVAKNESDLRQLIGFCSGKCGFGAPHPNRYFDEV
jgi:hypothetical protein